MNETPAQPQLPTNDLSHINPHWPCAWCGRWLDDHVVATDFGLLCPDRPPTNSQCYCPRRATTADIEALYWHRPLCRVAAQPQPAPAANFHALLKDALLKTSAHCIPGERGMASVSVFNDPCAAAGDWRAKATWSDNSKIETEPCADPFEAVVVLCGLLEGTKPSPAATLELPTTPGDVMPVFVLKAKDNLALAAIEEYRLQCCENDLLSQSYEVSNAQKEIEAWRNRNRGKCKMPDHKHREAGKPGSGSGAVPAAELAACKAELFETQMDSGNYRGACEVCHTVNADMLTDSYCAACKVAELEASLAACKEVLAAYRENEIEIEAIAATVLGAEYVRGDSHGVPGAVECVDEMRKRLIDARETIERLERELDEAKAKAVKVRAECECFGPLCPSPLAAAILKILDYGIPQFPTPVERTQTESEAR